MDLRLRKRLRITVRKLRRIRPYSRRRRVSPALRIVGGMGLMVIIGTILMMMPWIGTTRSLTFMEALFTTVSALSVTGLSIIVPGKDLTMIGKITLLCLIQAGGVGFMVVAVVAFRLLGRRVALVDRLALCDSLGLLNPQAVVKLTRQVLFAVITIESVGAVLLWLNWRGQLGDQRAFFFAVFHAISSFCNAGFDLFGELPEQFPMGIPTDTISLSILGSLIFLGGLGIPVMGNLLSLHQEKRVALHTKITLTLVVSLVFIGGFTMFVAERQFNRSLDHEPWYRLLFLCIFQSVSARTAGFAGIQPFDQLSPASQLVLIVLMFIGAAPASMGGGITTGTFAVLMLSLWSYARGYLAVQVGGRSISSTTVRKAAAILTVSLFLVVISTWAILLTHHVPINVALFEVVSAFATCGLSLGFTTTMNTFGQLVIVCVMFWGRLGALTIVVAMAQQRPSQLIEYPEEQILIG